jgi:hypothetical protein
MRTANIIVLVSLLFLSTSLQGGVHNESPSASTDGGYKQLSQAEIDGLIQIREEEKLAGDVYLALYKKWNLRTFANIEKSERTHMEAMKKLLDQFSIEDPVKSTTPGIFKSKHMTDLYNNLVEKGLKSLNDALLVAAEIEELDIADIQTFLNQTTDNDIKVTYQNLIKGSRNHLRAFNRQLVKRRISYNPVHISKEYFDKIISSRNESGAITDPDFTY